MTKNTYRQGSATAFFFPKGKKYVGVCLELDIVDEDTDLAALKERLREQIESYVKYVCEKKKSEDLLNRPAPAEYWRRFADYVDTLKALGDPTVSRRVGAGASNASVESYPLHSVACV